MTYRRGAALAAGLGAAAALSAPSMAQSPPPGSVVTSLTLFAGTAAGLSWSRDWGGTWQAVEAKRGLAEVGAVHDVLPVGPRVYVAGEGGLFVSEDFGQNFTRTALVAPVLCVLPSRYPQSDPTVFAGTPEGLLKSEDGGRTFQPTSLRETRVHRLAWPGPALLVATGEGVRVSIDAGKTFEPPGAGLPPGEVRALALSSFYPVDPVSFAGVGSGGVYRSKDGARTWTAAGLAGQAVTDLVWLGPLLYAASDAGLFRSEDLGRSWVLLGKGLSGPPSRLLFPLAPSSGAELFLAAAGGLFRSQDGGSQFTPSGLPGQAVLTVATFPAPEVTPGRGRKR